MCGIVLHMLLDVMPRLGEELGLHAVLGIHWHFGADPDPPDPYLWLMVPDSAPGPDPTPDPTPFFSDFKDAKTLYQTFILQALFQNTQNIYEKREGSGAGSSVILSD